MLPRNRVVVGGTPDPDSGPAANRERRSLKSVARTARPSTRVGLRVGPTSLVVETPRASWAAWPKRFRPFAACGPATMRLTLVRAAPPSAGEPLFDSGGVWRASRLADGSLLYEFRTGGRVYKAVRVGPDRTRGVLYFPGTGRGRGPRSAVQYPLDELLFQHYWASRGWAEVHACGVSDRGRMLLFAGQSGAGKTTTARLWTRHTRARILSDDRVLLIPGRAGVRAAGTPWHGAGRFARHENVPLDALFFLEQATASTIRPIAPPEAAARLFARTFPPPWDRDAVSRTLDACARIASAVPAFVLRFRKDASAIAAARAALRHPS